mgnify:FL=1
MKADANVEQPQCQAWVAEPPGFWHRHECRNPAKSIREWAKASWWVCGVHARTRYPVFRETG